MTSQVFDKRNVDDIDWHQIEQGPEVSVYLEPLIRNGTDAYVSNSQHEVQLLVANRQAFPLVIAGSNYGKTPSYVVSNLCQYFDYVADEIVRSTSYGKTVRFMAQYLIPLARGIAATSGMERTVYVNNWLFSSNLYPNCSGIDWEEVLVTLQRTFPDSAIMFRSVDEKALSKLKLNLEASGCKALSARLLYYLDFKETNLKKKRPYQQDKKRWVKQTDLRHHTLPALDKGTALSILEQYSKLYIGKHSKYNPAYTPLMLQNLHKSGFLNFEGIFEEERLLAIQLVWMRNGVATTPFIGYDQDIPSEKGLYRSLNTILTELSAEAEVLLNMSSGADKFKIQRGGKPTFEYNMVYFKHLKTHRQWVWKFFVWAGKKYFQPAMLQKAQA